MSPPPSAGLIVSFSVVVTVAVTVALLHLLLLAFEKGDRRNLFLALFAAAFALVAFLDYRERVDAEVMIPGIGPLQMWAVSSLILAAVRFAFSLFAERAPKRFWLYVASVFVLLLIAIPRRDLFPLPAGILGLIITVDALAAGVFAWRRLRGDAWIVAAGATVMGLGGALQMTLDLYGAEELGNLLNPYVWGGVTLLVASSVYLAKSYARTRRELERRLIEVQELSEQALAQEQAAREREVERRLLAIENQRRGEELEEARRLQLALLPHDLPEVSGFEVGAKMVTATEVGGDYYDVAVADGVAWLAVGDAVGHGARAGSLSSVLKGLFAGVAAQPSPAVALQQFDAALREMQLERAHVALCVARIEGAQVDVASAGMPPALIRRGSGEVEELAFSTLPLGMRLPQRYGQTSPELASGDVLLLSSDGLAEYPDASGSPRGYDFVRRVVAETSPDSGSLSSWVDKVLHRGLGEVAPPDDVTLLALRAD